MKRLAVLPLVLFLLFFVGMAQATDVYYCPMKCEGAKTYEKQGECPVCGMRLEKLKSGESSRSLNTRDYRMDLATDPTPPEAGKPTTITLTPRRTKDNSVVKELDTVHEKKLHLILVSQDLSWFSHQHPEVQADGSLKLPFTFPEPGNYILYADFTPSGDRNQVFPLAMQVAGTKKAPVALKESSLKQKRDGYEVSLKVTPALKADAPVTLTYKLRYKGKDVKDLGPYLGALGHNVVVSEDTAVYLHAHPPHHGGHDHVAPKAGGPEVSFMTTFPNAGLYKSWVQFSHQGKVLTFDFVLRVP